MTSVIESKSSITNRVALFLFLASWAFLIFGCRNNSVQEKAQLSEVGRASMAALEWYSNLPRGSFPDIAWQGERAYMKNKDSHLQRLRESGFFTTTFIDSLQKEYNRCEAAEAYSEADHFACLEYCSVICVVTDADSVHLSIVEERVEGNKASLVSRGYYRYISQSESREKVFQTRLWMRKEEGKWLIDHCREISE